MRHGGGDSFASQLLSAAVDGISNDRFMAFIDATTMQYLAPTSPKCLPWFAGAQRHIDAFIKPDGEQSPPEEEEEEQNGGTSIAEFSRAHFDAFATCRQMYESRLRSATAAASARLGGGRSISEAEFVALCEAVVASGEANTSTGTSSSDASPHEVCRALLEIVQWVGNFEEFCAMMAAKQKVLLGLEEEEEEEEEEEQE